jgi:hypothetical protein
MGRRFLVGAATAVVILMLGLRKESRMPDQAGPGEEAVAFHGFCVYRREISRAEAERLSPYPALLAAGRTVAAGAVVAGGLAELARHSRRRA